MIRPNRQVRALIGDRLGEEILESFGVWNDRGQDDLSTYGVSMSPDEAKAQDDAYQALIKGDFEDNI